MIKRFLLLLCLTGCLKTAGLRYPELPTQSDGALHVVVFDVGQADAMLVLYKGKSLLVDAGTSRSEPRKATQRIPRRLDALLGSRHIDYFMISHFHRDHFGGPGHQRNAKDPTGIFALIEREGLTIGTILDRGDFRINTTGAAQKHYQRAIDDWLHSGAIAKRRVVHAGDKVDFGAGLDATIMTSAGNGELERLQALFPLLYKEFTPTENDYSVGLKMTRGDFEMFTAGDLSGQNVLRQFGTSKESYNDMESRIASQIGAVEVYRVNHHGSRFSSNPCFLEVLAPEVSVISAGDNTYGHPDPAIVERLHKYGDVRITGGAGLAVRAQVEADIVGDDVEVLVAPDGKHFWVNGREYASKTEAEEAARPGARATCVEEADKPHIPEPPQPTQDEAMD